MFNPFCTFHQYLHNFVARTLKQISMIFFQFGISILLFKNEIDRLLANDITRIVSSIGIDRVGGGRVGVQNKTFTNSNCYRILVSIEIK